MSIPSSYCSHYSLIGYVRGIAIYIDPNFKVLSEAYPYVSKRLLTDPAPELRDSLRDLLFKDGRLLESLGKLVTQCPTLKTTTSIRCLIRR